MPSENKASRPAALIRIVSVGVGFNGNVKVVMAEAVSDQSEDIQLHCNTIVLCDKQKYSHLRPSCQCN